MYRDGPTGAAVDVIEHAAEGIGESACQFYGKVGSDCAHVFRVAAAAERVSYDMCFSALTPSGRSTAAGEFELLGGGGHLLGVLEFSDGWLESDVRRASMALRVCVAAPSHSQEIGALVTLRSGLHAARHALSTQAVIGSTADVADVSAYLVRFRRESAASLRGGRETEQACSQSVSAEQGGPGWSRSSQ